MTISVLLPCKDQKREFFLDAVGSLVRQTSSHWELLILTDPSTPSEIAEWATSFADPRIRICPCPETGFAKALNHGMRLAGSEFVSILLSDDRYAPDAIATLLDYRCRFPDVDFFHSARRLISVAGEYLGGILGSPTTLTLDYFKTRGSPVKHLLCWRRPVALAIGGMDESLSVHGCDDYDFPWSMAEAGARFQYVDECLYEYRRHHEHDRLTTTVPLERQMATLRAMFAKHAVPLDAADQYLQRAIGKYLVASFTDQTDQSHGAQAFVRCFRDADASALPAFIQAGFKERKFFPHRVFALPKGGPDGFKLARRMTGVDDPSRLLEFVLYALPPLDTRFPPELSFDDDLQWHQQQFGLPAQVACANVVRQAGTLRCYLLLSDLVQRVARQPAHRSQIDNRFKGWAGLLLNAVLAHAVDNGFETVFVARSELVLRNTDPRRNPKAPLYQRIYDDPARALGAEADGDWWRLEVPRIRNRIAPLERAEAVDQWPKTVCIAHDTERGLGHLTADPNLARRAEASADEALHRMLSIETRLGVKTTYNVVGVLFDQLRRPIEHGGHAFAFHSYDHRLPGEPDAPSGADGSEQLRPCRKIDYRIKGYRPPQSKILPGLNDANLSEFNFEWLASSTKSLGSADPFMENGIVKIPHHLERLSDVPKHDVICRMGNAAA